MRKISRTKKGFTLLEMMLSLAIITIISGCLYTLVVAIKDSYISTYNSDDSIDYAMLYAKAFENDFLARTQQSGVYHKDDEIIWYSGVEGGVASLYREVKISGGASTTSRVFTMSMNKVYNPAGSGTVDKWKILMTYSVSGNCVNYKITCIDNYYDPGVVRCIYEGGFWLPHNGDAKFEANGTATAFARSGGTELDGLKFKFS